MSLLFHSLVGPFAETTFVLFYDRAEEGAFNLRFDTGPEWMITDIFSDDVRIFKFLPGEAGEIRVSKPFREGEDLLFEARAIPVFGAAVDFKAFSENAVKDQDPICFNLKCGGHPCPDPTKPDLRCPGGKKECYKAEPDE